MKKNMTTELATVTPGEAPAQLVRTPAISTQLEKVLLQGDLSPLSSNDRIAYYRAVCESVGLNPLTKPFEFLQLNGKLVLYALKGATDQLRRIYSISIGAPTITLDGEFIIVSVVGTDATGRSDSDIGVVSKKDLQGNYGNALMKAVTKAKRRLTLSMCGLGMLDETEVETIPGARPLQTEIESPYAQPHSPLPATASLELKKNESTRIRRGCWQYSDNDNANLKAASDDARLTDEQRFSLIIEAEKLGVSDRSRHDEFIQACDGFNWFLVLRSALEKGVSDYDSLIDFAGFIASQAEEYKAEEDQSEDVQP